MIDSGGRTSVYRVGDEVDTHTACPMECGDLGSSLVAISMISVISTIP